MIRRTDPVIPEDHVCHQLCLTKVVLVPEGDTGDE